MSAQRPHSETELIDLVRAIDVRAPEELHRRVQALVADGASSSPRPSRRSGRLGLGLGGASAALAGIAAVLVLALAGTGSSTPSVGQTSALALRAATIAPPGESPRHPGTLTAAVDGLSFPYWAGRLGWRAVGARRDRLDGRAVTTVFYSDARAQRVGYAILAGAPPAISSGGSVAWRAGTPYHLLATHGVRSVIWLRAGHLCVVAGRGVSSATLLTLASWHERPSAS